MRLKKLEIYGFKSFAERVELTFEDGITGIVGPNGTGKSNITDAVRWVLGEQSAKTLRGGKMEDVIFSGTEKRRRLAWCEVNLVFDNEQGALPVDFSEVAVARRVYRNGDSEYLLNGSPCRLKDVIDLFRDTGIGREGYSLIGQGRIDEILSAKSEDRRQVFEEAAGIVKYKTRKNDAERRMENTRLNLSRVEDILLELEGRLDPLKEQSREAREYLQLRDELKGLELNAFLQRADRVRVRTEELRAAAIALDDDLAANETERAALHGERERGQSSLDEMETQAAEAREHTQTMIQAVEAREGAVNVLRERMMSTERDRARLIEEAKSAEQGEEGLARHLQELHERIAQEGGAAQSGRDELDVLEGELAEKARLLEEKENEAEELKARIIEAMNKVSDVRSERARLTAMEAALGERIRALHTEDDGERTAQNICEERLALAEEQLLTEQAEKEKLDRELAGTIAEVDRATEKLAQLSSKMQSAAAQRQEASSRLKVLEEMQRDYEGYYNSVKQVLLQAKRRGGGGVHGVVANLLQVPRKLERAIDMVLGAALQNVVVTREEDAKEMIDYLRQNRLGRATFLPISAVQGRTLNPQERKVLSMPGCVGLASELIKFDSQYQGIIDNLLGRTMIAENLDAGIAIQRAGRHTFRLVTLEGDVMHAGGSMTGGSAQSQVTSLLSREREVSEHRELCERLAAELEAFKSERVRIEEEIAARKTARADQYERVNQQGIAVARAETYVKSASDGLTAQRERGGRIELERTRMEEQLQEVAESLKALSGEQGEAEERSAGRQAEVAAMQRAIAADREVVNELNKNVSDRRVLQASRERGLQAITADRDRITRERGNAARLAEQNKTALQNCDARLREDGDRLAGEEQSLAEEKKRLDAAREAFFEIDARRTDTQRRLQEFAAQIDALAAARDQLTDRRSRAEVQLTRLESEISQLTERIWEDYDLSYAGAEEFRVPDFKVGEAERRIAAIKERIREMGAVNVSAMDEYREVSARFEEMSAQRDDLIKAQMDLQGIIEELSRKMETQFKQQFALMNANFQETFVALFGGGRAELQLADPKDALNCGIEVVAQPPGKKLQLLSLLSGGERALTAIAILFAMLKLKPTPFCFLDEIEAALDDVNIVNFAEYLKDYSRKTQFVVVTHRKGTMERCNALYGVTMEEKGVSRMMSIRLKDA